MVKKIVYIKKIFKKNLRRIFFNQFCKTKTFMPQEVFMTIKSLVSRPGIIFQRFHFFRGYLDMSIRNTFSLNLFKKKLLKCTRPDPNLTFNILNTGLLKLLSRLQLVLSHLHDHKFRHHFQNCAIGTYGQDIETKPYFLLNYSNHYCESQTIFQTIHIKLIKTINNDNNKDPPCYSVTIK